MRVCSLSRIMHVVKHMNNLRNASCYAILIFLFISPAAVAWEPNIQLGVSLAGLTFGPALGAKITDRFSARIIIGGYSEDIIRDGKYYQGQLLYFPRIEKTQYVFVGTGRVNGRDTFVRGGIGNNWDVSPWLLNFNVGLSIKASNRDEELLVDDIVFFQPFGFGVYYVFGSK